MWSICTVSGRWYPDTQSRKVGLCSREIRTGPIECMGRFRCRKDLQCIDRKLRCDCKPDCRDGTDEIGCKNPKKRIFVDPNTGQGAGVLTSPNYPYGYPKVDFQCKFYLYADPKYRIRLRFEEFSLRGASGGKCTDYLRISGINSVYWTAAGRSSYTGRISEGLTRCGRNSFNTVISNSSRLEILVKLAAAEVRSKELQGYSLTWSVLKADEADDIINSIISARQNATRNTKVIEKRPEHVPVRQNLLAILIPVAISALLPLSVIGFLCFHLKARRQLMLSKRKTSEEARHTEGIRQKRALGRMDGYRMKAERTAEDPQKQSEAQGAEEKGLTVLDKAVNRNISDDRADCENDIEIKNISCHLSTRTFQKRPVDYEVTWVPQGDQDVPWMLQGADSCEQIEAWNLQTRNAVKPVSLNAAKKDPMPSKKHDDNHELDCCKCGFASRELLPIQFSKNSAFTRTSKINTDMRLERPGGTVDKKYEKIRKGRRKHRRSERRNEDCQIDKRKEEDRRIERRNEDYQIDKRKEEHKRNNYNTGEDAYCQYDRRTIAYGDDDSSKYYGSHEADRPMQYIMNAGGCQVMDWNEGAQKSETGKTTSSDSGTCLHSQADEIDTNEFSDICECAECRGICYDNMESHVSVMGPGARLIRRATEDNWQASYQPDNRVLIYNAIESELNVNRGHANDLFNDALYGPIYPRHSNTDCGMYCNGPIRPQLPPNGFINCPWTIQHSIANFDSHTETTKSSIA